MRHLSLLVLFLIAGLIVQGQTEPCDGSVILLDGTFVNSDTIAASDTLFSSSIISGDFVIFQSPVTICFESGFEIQMNSEFTANLDSCLLQDVFELSDFFGSNIKLDSLFNYANQEIPAYITKDNTGANLITDMGATLGRVLFYDQNLSLDNSISCSSCHQQVHAFSDLSMASTGINGVTGRHSMRLINTRFSDEVRFFWDERATTLEDQTTQPIQDHIEMGFSGSNGDPSIDSLIVKMSNLPYYPILFDSVYGSTDITEEKMQNALAQFIRSIQSFDSRFDEGRAQSNNNGGPFPNYSQEENRGKSLFLMNAQFDSLGVRTSGGLGCQRCHRAPEFDIAANSRNNGVIGVIGDSTMTDVTNTRSPSLRDVFNISGTLNGPMMHDASLITMEQVIDHYNEIPENVTNIDNRLQPNGHPQRLVMTEQEKLDLIDFLKTLSGTGVYTDPKWSDPFIN